MGLNLHYFDSTRVFAEGIPLYRCSPSAQYHLFAF